MFIVCKIYHICENPAWSCAGPGLGLRSSRPGACAGLGLDLRRSKPGAAQVQAWSCAGPGGDKSSCDPAAHQAAT